MRDWAIRYCSIARSGCGPGKSCRPTYLQWPGLRRHWCPAWWSAAAASPQHRAGGGPDGSAKRSRVCREQAFHGWIQRSAARRPFRNRRHCDPSVPRSGRERIDQVSGSPGGMVGAPPQFFRISAAQCAREAVAGFECGEARVFSGRAYRFVMRVLPLLPLWLRRKQAANAAARLRAGRKRDS